MNHKKDWHDSAVVRYTFVYMLKGKGGQRGTLECDGAMLKQMKSQSASSLSAPAAAAAVSAAIFTQDDTDGRTQFTKGVPGSVLLLLPSSLWICFGRFT